ncbi:sulfotransferase domain-containing protein [Salipiger pacificus]|nr:sulfotransferase domain-containing protein [Alloyangia pacifica]MCA0948011.1 sulfotransferase domain-containing protein [Alloyangia pacifica]
MNSGVHGYSLPDFIYVGTGKVATTWFFEVLKAHPSVFMTPVKETNFFDLNYDRGLAWYKEFFVDASEGQKIGEISHRYLHVPGVEARIKDNLPSVKIIIGLREPVDYCMSDYLFCLRNGRYDGSFSEWVANEFDWSSVAYRDMIDPYLNEFGVENVFLYTFDQVKNAPQETLDRLCEFLGVASIELSNEMKSPVNVAAKARSKNIASMVNRASKFLKRRGGQRIIAKVKYNTLVQRALFKPIDDKPKISGEDSRKILGIANEHIEWLDKTFDGGVSQRWYGK